MKNNVPNLLAKLEHARDIVKRSGGKVTITAYAPGNRDYFRIEFDKHENRGAFVKYTSCEGDTRETVEQVWPSLMYDVFDTPGAVINVEIDNNNPCWFNTAKDPEALRKMFNLVEDLDQIRRKKEPKE